MQKHLLSKVDKRTKYSVYGWIREYEKALNLSTIAHIISSISILYFRDDGIFDIEDKSECMILSQEDLEKEVDQMLLFKNIMIFTFKNENVKEMKIETSKNGSIL